MKTIVRTLLYCYVVLFAFTIKAQESAFKWFTEADGLPSKWVNDINQDEQGNIVIASYVGLTFFDGKNFTLKTVKNGLPQTQTSAIKKDKKGRLWFVSYSGKISYLEQGKIRTLGSYNKGDYSKSRFFNMYFKSNNEVTINSFEPNITITYEYKGSKWVKKGKDIKRKAYMLFLNPKNPDEVLASTDVEFLSDSIEKLIIIHGYPDGNRTNLLTKRRKTRFSTLFTNSSVYYSIGNSLYEFGRGKMIRQRSFSRQITGMYEGKHNSIWVTLLDGGIIQIDKTSMKNRSNLILSKIKVNAFFEDRQGGLWLCTPKGIAYKAPSFFKPRFAEETLHNTVNRIFKCNDTLFIGHINGDVGYLVPGKVEKEKVIYVSPYQGTSLSGSIRDFEFEIDGNILFSTSNSGIYRINRKDFKVTQLCYGWCNALIPYKDAVLASYTDIGLVKITPNSIDFFPVPGDKKKISNGPYIENLFEDQPDHFLCDSKVGLYGMKDNKFSYLGKHPVLRERLYSMYRLNRDFIAFGSFGRGILICSKKDTILIDSDRGLVNDQINDMLVDREGRLWVATTNGISVITFLKKNHFDRYKIYNIEGAQCLNLDNFNFVEMGDKLFVSSNYGILEIKKTEFNKRISCNPLNILQIKLNSKILQGKKVQFLYGQNSQLELNFRSNRFHNQQQVHYYYRLKNQNDVWSMTKSENVSFNSLAPGNYQFEVYSQEPGSEIKSAVKRVEIEVLPRFWQKPWFLICVVLLLIALINTVFFIIVRRKTRKLENEKLILNLQQQALNGKLNPHFIFNALNSIQNFILTKDEKAAHYYLGKFSNLIRVILDNASQEFITLESEIKNLSLYLEIEQMRLSNSFEFQVEGDPQIKTEFETIPNMILQPFVENAILHGLAPLKERKGYLRIYFALEDGFIRMIIEDNGIGRAAAYENKMKKEKFYESMGVSLAKEKISVYAILQKRNAQFFIEDLGTKEKPLGTKVCIVIPRRSHR